jgi:hypothetical protein
MACGGQTQSAGGTGGSGGVAGGGGAAAGSGGAAAGSGGSAGAGTGGASGATGTGGAGASDGGAGTGGAGGAGAGGTTGTGGSGGGAGPVLPMQVAGTSTYRFTAGDEILEIDAATGARVSKLSLSGADLLVAPATDPTTWGSVFWTSPRSAWTPVTWPPSVAIDNGAYSAAISGSHLMLMGSTDTSMGVGMSKDYAVDATSGWITINYTIHTTKAIMAAPWEVSRVPRGGMVFFPVGASTTPGPLTVTQSAGMVWFDDTSKTATSTNGAKLTADGTGGWDAYVFGGNLFLKRFTDTPANAQAPSPEGEICIYPGATWLEFEVQGRYTSIAANGSLPWQMQWRVVKIPGNVSVAVGSGSLVTFAQQQAAM